MTHPSSATARPASTRSCATMPGPIPGSRSTRRTASTARPATSRTRPRTSTGWCRRAAADRTIPTCDQGQKFLPKKGITTMSSVSASNRFPLLLASIVPIDGLLRTGLLAVLGSMVLALSAKIQIPFWPVPMTMQSVVVLMLGMAYGSRLALGTLLLYLADGAAGLPVFAGTNAGFAYMIGPTGGYLIGFLFAAVLLD